MRSFLILLLLPLKIFSQDIEGVWTGTIYNDTTHKYIPYELAISNNNGKLSGYSNTTFIGENNNPETGVKSLKIKKKNTKILVEDDELIFNNYAEPPPKGVKQYSILNVMRGDSGLLLIGVFSTNRTKQYASLTGTIRLQKKEKISETKIIPRLDELKLSNTLSFNQPKKEKENIVIAAANTKAAQPTSRQKGIDNFLPDRQNQTGSSADDANAEPMLIAIKEDTVTYKADVVQGKDFTPYVKTVKQDVAVAKPQTVKQKTEIVKVTPAENKKTLLPQPKKDIVSVPESAKTTSAPGNQTAVAQKEIKKTQPVSQQKEKPALGSVIQTPKTSTGITQNNNKVIAVSQQAENKSFETPVQKVIGKEAAIVPVAKPVQKSILISAPLISAEKLAGRTIETIRTVNFISDSLTLTLYDNGVVDGDTVTILLNGKIIMPKQGLSTKAITKTIYITPDIGDSLQLIMYAENLGSIPPNTGLLIIQDGEEAYQIRFAGDLKKNSAIILKRKRLISQ